MKLLKVLVAFSGLVLISLGACNYHIDKIKDNSNLMQELIQNPDSIGFDTLKSTIFQAKCFSCHGAGKNDLSSYSQFKLHIQKAVKLIDQDKMPKSPNPPLSPQEKQVITMWVSMGAPEFAKTPINLPPEDPLTPTFHSIKKSIIDKKCISCHIPKGTAEDYPFDSYEDVVDPIFGVLKPGDPDTSDMVIYIEKPDTDKDRMPPPDKQPRLSDDEINAIRTWIKNGAKND